MQTIEDILVEHPFFKSLEPAYLQLIAGCGSNVRFNAGDYIFREGEDANHFYIIRYGKVALEVFVPKRGFVTIQTISEGDVVGWSWLFPPYRWFLNARAIEPVRAIALDGKCLRTKCEEDPKLGFELMKRFARIITERLQATRLQVLDVYRDHT
jgi:CRP-like cAMP-binding protein